MMHQMQVNEDEDKGNKFGNIIIEKGVQYRNSIAIYFKLEDIILAHVTFHNEFRSHDTYGPYHIVIGDKKYNNELYLDIVLDRDNEFVFPDIDRITSRTTFLYIHKILQIFKKVFKVMHAELKS